MFKHNIRSTKEYTKIYLKTRNRKRLYNVNKLKCTKYQRNCSNLNYFKLRH